MRIRFMTFFRTATLAILIPGSALAGFTQQQQAPRPMPPAISYSGYRLLNDDLRYSNFGHYSGSPLETPFAGGQSIAALAEQARRAHQQAEDQRNHDEYLESVRLRAARMEARRQEEAQYDRDQRRVQQPHADPEAPDQSELLRNSHDRDFILRNFRTMYVEVYDVQFFGSDQMKAALGKNKEFEKLNIRIVDDPRVADTVLKVSYTFAWDYPFELRHQNTTIVLLSGKGEGPFSGPLGAADVARQFVNAAKQWREIKATKPATDQH